MTRDLTLSQQVQTFLDTYDIEADLAVSAEEHAETKQIRRAVKLMVDDVVSSRQSLTENRLAFIERLVAQMPDDFSSFLDDRYTREVIDAVPGYVKRTLELSRLESSRLPSKLTNGYLHEAVRTYIFGFPQASIALSRAALEQALKEELGHQGRKIFLDMNRLLDEAEGLGTIDGVIRKTARKIATEADTVLHEKPADLAKAYNVLLMLRGVLQHIYAE